MIEEFNLISKSGANIIVDTSLGTDEIFSKVTEENYQNYFDGSLQGISWKYNGKRIIISDKSTDVFGYPTIDQKYIITIYKDESNQYKPPNNAVIYNLDGRIHRILKVPELASPKILEKIKEENHSNPPVEDNRYGYYGLGLQFKGFAWRKDREGNLVNAISIQYVWEYGEWRFFDPKTGEFGELIDDWYQSRGWR